MTKKCHRILLTEDHKILREGLKALLSVEPDIEVIGEAEDGRMAIRYAEMYSPDSDGSFNAENRGSGGNQGD